MKKCPQCHVNVETLHSRCPLCYADLKGQMADDFVEPYPKGEVAAPPRKAYNITMRALVFTSLVAAAVCLLANGLSDRFQKPWSLVVIGGILFIWLLVRYVIMGKVNIARRLMMQLVGSEAFVLLLEWFITDKSVIQGVAFTYVIPFMNVAATTAITMILVVRYLHWTAYTLYQFITAMLGLLPLLFWLLGWIQPGVWWPSLVSAAYSLAILAGMFIFANRKYKNELARRFHL